MKRIWRARIWKGWKPSDARIRVEIDLSAVELAQAYYNIVEKRPGARTGDRRARIDGWLGQLLFQSLLIKLNIPFMPHLPIYSPLDPEYGRPYDFYIEEVGQIEVKTTARNPAYKRFMCNVAEWRKAPCNYVVGVKVRSDKEAVIMGWFSRKELEDLPIDNWSTGDCYHCLLTEMNPMSSFIAILEERRTR